MGMDDEALSVALFARYPRAGEAKTRLAPLLGDEGAARLHRKLVERTLETLRASRLPFAVWTTGEELGAFRRWLGENVPLVDQGQGDLGARLARVAPPAIVLGADVPDLAAHHLRAAAQVLREVPVVIGPATDGGYYLLGFTRELPFLWQDMRWGTQEVLSDTQARLDAAGIAYRMLEPLADCDRPEDLARWPELVG